MFSIRRNVRLASFLCASISVSCMAATLRVPDEHPSIQSAIDAAQSGDTVLVGAGTYKERLRLKPSVLVKSEGDNTKGKLGLKRAESTIVNGGFKNAKGPGVEMAEDSTLDGFTVTGIGRYDDATWRKHHATFGEEQPHEHIGAAGTAGIAIDGVARCTVVNNIVHHIGYTGIAVTGVKDNRVTPHIYRNFAYRNMGGGIGSMNESTAIIEENVCFENFYAGIGHNNASPLVINNTCYENVRAGIGISERSKPIVRGNKCYRNRRAGIGIRTGSQTQPIVEENECHENEMAGIGNRDDARPLIRHNRCYKNKMAGIGSRDGARAVIEHNECYENEMSGIGSRLGAAPIIRYNRCFRNQMAGIGAREKATPVIEDNECFENQMAGIGSQQDAAPTIRNNRCYRNEMAGIGSRSGARPVIVDNECFENEMAGIGAREGATSVVRGNHSHHNRQAGIGNRLGARSIIVENDSHDNQTAGVGVRGKETVALVVGNRCRENRLVAIGLPDGATGLLHGNELQRTGGVPPLVAIKGGSVALVTDNIISGGGVAGVLAQGDVVLIGNRFQGKGLGQGSAVWVWKDSKVMVARNHFSDYRNAVNASGSNVTATNNVIRGFDGAAFVVKKLTSPPIVYGNIAISANPKDTVVDVDVETAPVQNAPVQNNVLKNPKDIDESSLPMSRVWPQIQQDSADDRMQCPAAASRHETVEDGPWKLVVTYGEKTKYSLFNTTEDPKETVNLATRLEQITQRMKGLLEKQASQKDESETGRQEPGR